MVTEYPPSTVSGFCKQKYAGAGIIIFVSYRDFFPETVETTDVT